jgi:ferrochelatase
MLLLLILCLHQSVVGFTKPMQLSRLGQRLMAASGSLETAIAPEQASMKLGVLMLNLGGPEVMEDVEGFLYNLFADPDIIRLPPILSILQKPIAYVIAKRRAPKSSAAYQSIGGGSPIVRYTGAQAGLIESALRGKGYDAKCYFAMRYWHPFTEEVDAPMKHYV